MFRHSCNFPYYFDDSDYENNGYGRCGRDRGCPGSFEPYNCCRPGPIGPRGCRERTKGRILPDASTKFAKAL